MRIDYVKACGHVSNMKITMQQVIMMREDTTNTYYEFLEYFVSAVVGKKVFKQFKCEKLLSEFVSKSDEAFALVVLENNLDTWTDMARLNVTKGSTVPKKYTNGGLSKNEIASSKKLQGWSVEGQKRFN